MRNGRAVSKQWRMQKSGQWRAEEELRCVPHAGRATWLFARHESHGQGAESLGSGMVRYEHPLGTALSCPWQGPRPLHGHHGAR